MITHEKLTNPEASPEEAERFAKLLQDKFPPPPISKSKPEGYYSPTMNHREDEDELVKAGQYAPHLMGLSKLEIKRIETASGEPVELTIIRGVPLDPDTQEPDESGKTLTRYKALYIDSEREFVPFHTVGSDGVVELPHDTDEKGFIVDIYDEGQVDVWHGLWASHIPTMHPQSGWMYSHRRATGQEAFDYYNDVELAHEVAPEPRS